jgi:sulfite reductase (NADPH) flavoprotein alpha-component
MAGDVEDALVDIIAEHGAVDRETAEQQVKELRRTKRYRRDVY